MDLRKPRKTGQAALEYMLILTVVAVVILLAIKPSATPSVLNRAQNSAEVYYNTVTEVIMGKDPLPINGAFCPPKPSGERECACPQPAFGGAPCTAPDPSIQYCGDGICGPGETGEPGHPTGPSDPLFTCFEDCDYLPDCDQCVTLVPSAACGTACGAAICSASQVCMTSDCPPGCAGYTQSCQNNPALCSGSCFCDPAQWVEVSGCGVPFGTCTPTAFEKCFQNASCSASCAPTQTLRAMSDPVCGACPATSYPIGCGTGTITIDGVNNGQVGSKPCPFGCTSTNMSALCTDGTFGSPWNVCQPAVCLATSYDTGVCGPVNLPITSPGNSTPPIPCPPRCTGTVTGICPVGTATFNVVGVCIPDNCPLTPYVTANCGSIQFQPTNHGDTTTTPCPPGCTGSGVSATCDRGLFVSPVDTCLADCPATPVPTGPCGVATLPAGTPSGVNGVTPCPGACTGNVTALCTNGAYGPATNTCLRNCTDLPVSAGSCGSGTILATTSGVTGQWDCGACSGNMTALCTDGSWGPVTNNCGCLARNVATSCGTATLPATSDNTPESIACPPGCAVGTVNGTCVDGTYTGVTNSCEKDCPDLPVSAGSCGSGTILGTTSGDTNQWDCGACSGNMTSTCNDGTWGPVSNNCGCLARNVVTSCGTATLPATSDNTPESILCPLGCSVGAVSGTCADGTYGGITNTCKKDCPDLPVSAGTCGSGTILGTTSGDTNQWDCGSCSGNMTSTCNDGSWGPVSNNCGCLATPVPTTSCGTPTLPAVSNGSPSSDVCQCGCTGSVGATCSGGTFTSPSNTCQVAYTENFTVAANTGPVSPSSLTVTHNDQSFTMCFATNVTTATLSGTCTPSNSCTINAQ